MGQSCTAEAGQPQERQREKYLDKERAGGGELQKCKEEAEVARKDEAETPAKRQLDAHSLRAGPGSEQSDPDPPEFTSLCLPNEGEGGSFEVFDESAAGRSSQSLGLLTQQQRQKLKGGRRINGNSSPSHKRSGHNSSSNQQEQREQQKQRMSSCQQQGLISGIRHVCDDDVIDTRRSSVSVLSGPSNGLLLPDSTGTMGLTQDMHGRGSVSSPLFNELSRPGTLATSTVGARSCLAQTNATIGETTLRSGILSQDDIPTAGYGIGVELPDDDRGETAAGVGEEGVAEIEFCAPPMDQQPQERPLVSVLQPPAAAERRSGVQQEQPQSDGAEHQRRSSCPSTSAVTAARSVPVLPPTAENLALVNEWNTRKAKLAAAERTGKRDFYRTGSGLVQQEEVHTMVGTHVHLRAWLDHQLAVRVRRTPRPKAAAAAGQSVGGASSIHRFSVSSVKQGGLLRSGTASPLERSRVQSVGETNGPTKAAFEAAIKKATEEMDCEDDEFDNDDRKLSDAQGTDVTHILRRRVDASIEKEQKM